MLGDSSHIQLYLERLVIGVNERGRQLNARLVEKPMEAELGRAERSVVEVPVVDHHLNLDLLRPEERVG